MDKSQRQCKLCANVSDDNFKVIDDAMEYIFGVLLLKSIFKKEVQDVMCPNCSQKSLAAFNFKSTCLYVDNTIIPYVDFEHPVPVNLKEIHAKEFEINEECDMLNKCEVCRLCLQPISGKQWSIQEVPHDNIVMYIPEINFSLTTNPVICEKCHNSLSVHSTFIRDCSDIEEKNDTKEALSKSCIKIEEIEIKSEKNDEDEVPLEIPFIKIKKEYEERENSLPYLNGFTDIEQMKNEHSLDDQKQLNQTVPFTVPSYETNKSTATAFQTCITSHQLSDKNPYKVDYNFERYHLENRPWDTQMYKCDECDYKSNEKRNVLRHQVIHKDPQVRMYKCDKCEFTTKHRWSLTQHQFRHNKYLSRHKNPAQMYKCDECEYKSSQKYILIKHQLIHKDPSEVPTYNCGECDYKSIRKSNLSKHQLRHKDPSQVLLNRCDECDFESIDKSNLRAHQVRRHRDRSEMKLYKCDECDYETVENGRLKKHMLRHKEASEVQMYKCEKCSYETKIKYHLVAHQLKHKNPVEVQMHKCDKCEFETKYRKSYSKHQLIHRDVSQSEVYKCDECRYETKDKRNLMRHRLKHKDSSELEKYRCGDCGYETIHISYFRKHQLKHKHHSRVTVACIRR